MPSPWARALLDEPQTTPSVRTATLSTAFGKTMPVEVTRRWRSAGEERAEVRTAGGTLAEVAVASLTWHAGSEPVTAQPDPSAALEAGLYRRPDGEVFRVVVARTSGKPYAKHLVVVSGADITDHKRGRIAYEYEAGAIRSLDESMRMTADEVGALGLQYGACVVCCATLTDPTSIAFGIGPVCRKRV